MKNLCFLIMVLFLVSCAKQEVVEDYSFYGSYAVLGDSISYGKGSSNGSSWADILRGLLHINEFEKLAVCGAVASSRFPAYQYDLKTQIESLEKEFDLITLMIGTNDCLIGKEIIDVDRVINLPIDDIDYKISFTHGFIYDLRLLLDRFPKSLVIIVSPPLNSYKTAFDLEDYIGVEKEVAQILNLPFIDLSSSAYVPRGDLICADMIHPTDKGYSIIANYVFSFLKENIL